MTNISHKLTKTAHFTGAVLLVDAIVLAGVGISCLFGETCTATTWSERTFWIGLSISLIAGPLAISVLGSGRPTLKNCDVDDWDTPLRQEQDSPEERKAKIAQRGQWSLRFGAVGVTTIIIGILIDVLSK